jgi:hypothetical protein
MTHPQQLPEQNKQFLPLAVVLGICDISRLFSLSSDMSGRAASSENVKVLSSESRANDVGLYLGKRAKFQQE